MERQSSRTPIIPSRCPSSDVVAFRQKLPMSVGCVNDYGPRSRLRGSPGHREAQAAPWRSPGTDQRTMRGHTSGQEKISGLFWHEVGCRRASGLWYNGKPQRACMGVRGPCLDHSGMLEVQWRSLLFPIPSYRPSRHNPPSPRPRPSRPSWSILPRPALDYTSPLTSKADSIQTVLLKRATITRIPGSRASIHAMKKPAGAP